MTILLDTEHATVVHGDWRETLAIAQERGGVDALICDPPYSAKTHAGNDGVAVGKELQRALDYAAWHPSLVAAFVGEAETTVRGWRVVLTDDVLAPEWRCAFDASGLYAFRALPCVISGMTVRQLGDGPASESIFAMVARPRCIPFCKWGSLPGYYKGPREPVWRVGGKPLWLMLALVRDYTARGDLIADPVCGGGQTAKAARILGRRFIGGDIDLAAAQETARVVSAAREQLPLFGDAR